MLKDSRQRVSDQQTSDGETIQLLKTPFFKHDGSQVKIAAAE
jgi:hypothetical protein